MAISSIEAALVAELEKVSGVQAVLDHVPKEAPDRLPALILQLRRFTQNYPGVGQLVVERDYTWLLLVWVPMRDYEDAQNQLKALWPALLDLQHSNNTLDVSCREWTVEDDGDSPTFDEARGVYEKRLTIHALTEEKT